MQLLQRQALTIVLCCALTLCGSHCVISQSTGATQTFAFRKFEAIVNSPYQMIHVSNENAQFVRSFVQKELEDHGQTLSPSPDMYVDLFVFLTLERQATGGHVGTVTSSALTSGISVYEVGTLLVQLIGVENNKLLWEGTRTITLWKKTENKIRRQVDKLVSRIFKDYDPSTLTTNK